MSRFAGLSACATVALTLATSGRALGDDCAGNTSFLVGSGVYDITGPAAELGMMGYAMLDQKTTGIHTRLRSRAFVIASPCNGRRVAIVLALADFLQAAIA